MHLLEFRFAPRIRDLGNTKLYVPKGTTKHETLKPTIGAALDLKTIRTHWNEIPRLATSIKQGTVTASLLLRKLGNYSRQTSRGTDLRNDRDIAEHVRKIGGITHRSVRQMSRLRRLKDNDADFVTPQDMLSELFEDYKALALSMKAIYALTDDAGDVATTSVLENWVDETERRSWSLRAPSGR
ncbi:Non-specific DNA-binding protein Dps / Iron-binding ferritin-like antioxidant protein / Ferroxidase [Acidisarcina polymorpha]|uniref:Non-specific DNA-binding protein Dps / Iron-binding ferritin-like antioxidant protein / Ferroxidase n=2 Tax=Acidisarcina polymorpha TaxID=2211140 RepID=A0A2Z5FWI7_9BACT|nr:Non-specific DNA-binding protein Dps / Iron-binding ferritin-like antioxidant protein / Ferroxidase [Acidisarcina polymorpha]